MRVLITGATGLIGSEIVNLCHEKEIGVNYLTTSKAKIQKKPLYHGFYWNPADGEIDNSCLEGVGAIIHLAGANVFRRWTRNNREKIINSRVDSAELLFKSLQNIEHQVGHFVSASAIGIYPHSYNKMYYEDTDEVDDNFLGEVVQKWEAAADRFKELGLRVAKVRVGIVLGEDGGALPKLKQSLKINAGAVLGSGKQWQSWIHLRDLARIFIFVVENGLKGVYNAVAPHPVTHKQMVQELAGSMDKKIWLPNIPAFVLKAIMGELASTVLSSQLVASKKIEDAGFNFYYLNISRAIEDLKQ